MRHAMQNFFFRKTLSTVVGILLFCLLFSALPGCKTGGEGSGAEEPSSWIVENSQHDWQAADFIYAKVEHCNNASASPEGTSLPNSFYYITIMAIKVNDAGDAVFLEFPLWFYENKENFFDIYTGVDRLDAYSDIDWGKYRGIRSCGYGKNDAYLIHPNLHVIGKVNQAPGNRKLQVSLAMTGKTGNFIHTEEVVVNQPILVWERSNRPNASISLETIGKRMEEEIPRPCEDCRRFIEGKIDFMEWSGKNHSSCLRSRLIGISVPEIPGRESPEI